MLPLGGATCVCRLPRAGEKQPINTYKNYIKPYINNPLTRHTSHPSISSTLSSPTRCSGKRPSRSSTPRKPRHRGDAAPGLVKPLAGLLGQAGLLGRHVAERLLLSTRKGSRVGPCMGMRGERVPRPRPDPLMAAIRHPKGHQKGLRKRVPRKGMTLACCGIWRQTTLNQDRQWDRQWGRRRGREDGREAAARIL